MSNPYEELANAIILQAVRDYRDALKKLAKGRKNTAAKDTKQECERFFRSQHFSGLTSIDGEMLIEKLNEEENDL